MKVRILRGLLFKVGAEPRCIGAQNAQRGLQAGIQPQTKTLRNLDTRARRHAPDCTSSPGNVKQGAAVRALCIRGGAR
jgi:hypothetical protein